MTGNTFENNKGAGVIRINANSSTISGRIEDNTFYNNAQVDSMDMKTIVILSSFDISLKNNKFSNPKAEHEIRVPAYVDGERIDASGCYWGTMLHADVISR